MWDALGALFGSQDASSQLQASGMLTKEQCLEFFSRCDRLLGNGEVQSHLRLCQLQGSSVEDAITALQSRVLEEMGVQGAWGLHCLGRIAAVYKADQHLMAMLYYHVRCCCRRAE